MSVLRIFKVDVGVDYWIAAASAAEAIHVVRVDCDDESEIDSITEIDEEKARTSVVTMDEAGIPPSTLWAELQTATRPCVLACSEC